MALALAIVAIGVPALFFVLFPFFKRKAAGKIPVSDPFEALRDEKTRIYRAIQEITFEHQAGHLSDDDYRELRERYEGEAARVVTRLDAADRARQPGPRPVVERRETSATERLPWSRRPLTVTLGSLVLVAFGLTLGLGISRYTAPDPGAMTAPQMTMPLPSREAPETPGGSGQRVITPEILQGMLAAAHKSLDAGRYQEAIAAYKAVLARNEKNVEALTHLGVILALAGHADNAIEAFDKAIAVDPNYAHAYWDKARVLSEEKKDWAGAIKAWEKFVALVPPGADRDQALKSIQEAKARLK